MVGSREKENLGKHAVLSLDGRRVALAGYPHSGKTGTVRVMEELD